MKIGKIEILPWTKTPYNNSQCSERMMEVPLLHWFIKQFDVMEVGAVSPYYLSKIKHSVYDPFDEYPGVIREKAEDLRFDGEKVLSISTVEHIGRGDYGQPINSDLAISVLKNMMKAYRYLVTWACAQNKVLDDYVETLTDNVIKLKRIGDYSWQQCSSLKNTSYGFPFPFGNGLYVITNCPELLIRDDLVLLEAFYGGKDVRNLLESYIERGSFLTLHVDNISLGGDPTPGLPKTLQVTYDYLGSIQILEVKEGEVLTINF